MADKGRIAGDDPFYTFRVMRVRERQEKGETIRTLEPTEHGFTFTAVTEILDEVLGKPAGAFAHWGYNLGIEGMSSLAEVIETIEELRAIPLEGDGGLKERLKAAGYAPNKVRDKAGDRGTRAHSVLAALAAGGVIPETSSDLLQIIHPETGMILYEVVDPDDYCRGVIRWWNERMAGWVVHAAPPVPHLTDVPLAAEIPVWSLEHRYCGSFDLLRREVGVNVPTADGTDQWMPFGGEPEDALEMMDLKTHKPATQKSPAYLHDVCQTAFYRKAWEELRGEVVRRSRIVVVDEKGRYFEDLRVASTDVVAPFCRLYHATKLFDSQK